MKAFSLLSLALNLIGFSSELEEAAQFQQPKHPSDGIYQEPKIVYGYDASPKQFPWMVSIRSRKTNVVKLCGGSLISDKHVLTAAHCTTGTVYATIGLGSNNLYEPRLSVVTSNFVWHEKYNSLTLNNDIAIFFLPISVIFDDFIKPIRLPTLAQASWTFAGVAGIVSGFGRHSVIYSTESQWLRYVYSRIISNSECQLNYGANVVTSSVMCALGFEVDRQGTCHMDSGGPLVVQEGNQFTQIGVVSFISSSGCGTGRPYGFMRTASQLAWISQKTGITVRLR